MCPYDKFTQNIITSVNYNHVIPVPSLRLYKGQRSAPLCRLSSVFRLTENFRDSSWDMLLFFCHFLLYVSSLWVKLQIIILVNARSSFWTTLLQTSHLQRVFSQAHLSVSLGWQWSEKYFYATLYSATWKIPVYSAYVLAAQILRDVTPGSLNLR